MSLKDIYNKEQAFSGITPNVNIEKLGEEVESVDYIKNYIDLSNRNLSNVDWEKPEEFARYGSAKKYYEDAINNIYSSYPYDGSLKEKIEWEIDSSELSLYMLENRYPRNNGYITIGKDYGSTIASDSDYTLTDNMEYIHFNGTLNTSPKASKSEEHFELSNKFSKDKNLGYNLNVDGENGCTVEFYLKKEDLLGSPKQVVFDLWNGEEAGTLGYGRFRIEIQPGIPGKEDKFHIELMSGSNGVNNLEIGEGLDFSEWKHYAISFKNEDSEIKFELYENGDRVNTLLDGSTISQMGKAVQAHIGSMITTVPGTTTSKGYGKLSGSLDEFRFWKRRRTDKQIARHYFTNLGAGVNTDEANTDLGVYFKFNEGIFSTEEISSYDKIVLDYSGRISNGVWTGYSLGSRSTDSAIVLSSNSEREFEDPVMYSTHPAILELQEHYSSYGNEYDIRNTNSLYSTLPDWISEQDSETGEKIKDLMQMMSEFFDDLFLKVQYLPNIKDVSYEDENKLSFVRKLLNNVGFKNLNLFEDSTLLEEFLTRTEDTQYEEKIFKVKKEIYKNIYNNIVNIYKSKGTNKSFRNLLHCFGIDENLVKIQTYADNLEYTLDDRYKNQVQKRSVVNFNKTDSFTATVYQQQEVGNPNSIGYLSGSDILKDYGNTMETSVIFPKKFDKKSKNYFVTDFIETSLFGMHESTNGTWETVDKADIRVFFRRLGQESTDGQFVLSAPCFSKELTSEIVKGVYDNEKWNFSLSIRKEKLFKREIAGADSTDYILELYGTNTSQDVKQKTILLSTKVSQSEAESYFQSNKMIYAGASRQNFSGSVLMKSDIRLESVRFWNNYIENNIVDEHSKDLSNFGPKDSYLDSYGEVKNINTLCLSWDFETVDSSDSLGSFLVPDASSGSLDLLNTDRISHLTKYQFTAKGDKFLPNDASAIKIEHLPLVRRNLPDDIGMDDFIKIVSEDDEIYKRDSVPLNHYFSIEKSMYSIISQDMLNWLGTVKDFNSLVGRPEYRYEQEYTSLEKMRNIFFRNVENEPDFESFLKFYKWVDEAILNSILQIVPASLNMVDNVFNVYESHILERNKYQHKLPTVELKGKVPEAVVSNLISSRNSWVSGCESRYIRATQNIEKRTPVSPLINNEINRQSKLLYNMEIKEMPLISEKKRETEIIRTIVGFDLTGVSSFEFDDLFETLKDC